MSEELQRLIALANAIEMTDAEREIQRRSFAYGNTHFENPLVTRESVDRAAEELASNIK